MINMKNLEKKIYLIRNYTIAIILIIFMVILIPFTPLFLVPLMFIIGEPKTYIIRDIIQNLFIPFITILVCMPFVIFLRILFFKNDITEANDRPLLKATLSNLSSRKIAKKTVFKPMLIFLTFVLAISFFSFKSIENIANAIADIPYAINCNYPKTEGVVTLLENPNSDGTDGPTFIIINGIRFTGVLSVYSPQLIEGSSYKAEYLPHTKYIVKIRKKN